MRRGMIFGNVTMQVVLIAAIIADVLLSAINYRTRL